MTYTILLKAEQCCLQTTELCVHITVKSSQDAQTLQNDLRALEAREKDWSMEFNPDNREVLMIT